MSVDAWKGFDMHHYATYHRQSNLPFYVVLSFLVFEYGRPHSFLPAMELIRPGMIIQLTLLFFLLMRISTLKLDNVQSKCFLLLVLIMTLHGPIAVNNYWALMMWKSMVLYFIMYLSIIHFIDSLPKLQTFVTTWIVVNIIVAVVGIYYGGKIPNSSLMGDENDFSLVMNMAIPFAYFGFLRSHSPKAKLFYLAGVGVFVTAVVSSMSRGGFVGLLPVILYCWYRTPRRKLYLLLLAFALVCVTLFSAPSQYWDEVKSITEENIEEGTGAVRWYYWKVGIRMFKDNPAFGVGQGNFQWNQERYGDPEGFMGRKHGGHTAHSLYITLISELGLAGAILVSVMLFVSIRNLRRILKMQKKLSMMHIRPYLDADIAHHFYETRFITHGIIGAWLGFLVSGLFLSVLYYPHLWILTALSLTITTIFTNQLRSKMNQKRSAWS